MSHGSCYCPDRCPLHDTQDWRPVPGYEGIYEASSDGLIRSLDRRIYSGPGRTRPSRGRTLVPQPQNQGRLAVTLSVDGCKVQRTVHSLVAEAFLGRRPDGHVVRHLNGDHLDNRVENLAWGTQSENALDAVRHGTHNQASKTHCPQGHLYDLENTYYRERDRRACRACNRAKWHRRKLAAS